MPLKFEEVDKTPHVDLYILRGEYDKETCGDRGEVQLVDGYAVFIPSDPEGFTVHEIKEIGSFMIKLEGEWAIAQLRSKLIH